MEYYQLPTTNYQSSLFYQFNVLLFIVGLAFATSGWCYREVNILCLISTFYLSLC